MNIFSSAMPETKWIQKTSPTALWLGVYFGWWSLVAYHAVEEDLDGNKSPRLSQTGVTDGTKALSIPHLDMIPPQ